MGRASGPVRIAYDLADRTIDCSEMYEHLQHSGGTILYCDECGKRLGRTDEACDFEEDRWPSM